MMAVSQPQAAYAALTKSLQCEWIYLQRVVPHCHALFAPLENVISSSFLPALFGCEVSPLEVELFSLPVRLGGLGICFPKHLAELLYNASRQATCIIVDSIKNIHCLSWIFMGMQLSQPIKITNRDVTVCLRICLLQFLPGLIHFICVLCRGQGLMISQAG